MDHDASAPLDTAHAATEPEMPTATAHPLAGRRHTRVVPPRTLDELKAILEEASGCTVGFGFPYGQEHTGANQKGYLVAFVYDAIFSRYGGRNALAERLAPHGVEFVDARVYSDPPAWGPYGTALVFRMHADGDAVRPGRSDDRR